MRGGTAGGGGGGAVGDGGGLRYPCPLLWCVYNALASSMAASSSTATTPLWHIYVWQATCLIESVECVCGRHFVNNNHSSQIFAQAKRIDGATLFRIPFAVSRIFLLLYMNKIRAIYIYVYRYIYIDFVVDRLVFVADFSSCSPSRPRASAELLVEQLLDVH